MAKLLSQIIAGILGLWLAILFVPEINLKVFVDSNFFGVPLTAKWHIIVLLGFILGLLNFFVKPILKTITLPLRVVTLGAFGLIINMGLIWAVDIIFPEITIPWFWPLVWTTLIVWTLGIAFPKIFTKRVQ